MIFRIVRNLAGLRLAIWELDARLVSLELTARWLQRERERAAELREIHDAIDALDMRARAWCTNNAVAEA